MSLIFTLLAFLLAISLLVAIHEYGHFLVARMCGIKVLRFSIGFGKPIWSRVAGADRTEYCISALPLGGYVKMLDEREGDVPSADLERSFQAQPIWQRIAVLLAGPMFNFLFVIVAFWVLFMIGVPTQKAVIGEVLVDSPAAVAGLREGDQIVAVDQQPVIGWEATFVAMIDDMVGDGTINLSVIDIDGSAPREAVLRVDESLSRLESPSELLTGMGFSRWRIPAVIGTIIAGGAAEQAGLQPGDRITAVDGTPVRAFRDVVEQLSVLTEPRAVELEFRRGGEQQTLLLTPQIKSDNGETRLMLGIGSDPDIIKSMQSLLRLGPIAAVPAAFTRLISETGFTLRMLGRMVTGDVSAKNLSGPVSIAQYAGEAAERGFGDYIRFLAVISISLGILNLLPVPMLDGGQIVYQTIEWIKGSPLSDRAQVFGQQVGIFLLLSVMVFAFYNDIARLFSQ